MRILLLSALAIAACSARGELLGEPDTLGVNEQVTSALVGEPVWPGSTTRYYPGIYPRFSGSIDEAQQSFEQWFADREDAYREFIDGTPVTHIGISFSLYAKHFFSDYWDAATSGPFSWRTECGRISAAQDPDAAPGGHPLYDWAWFDELLAQPFISESGGKIIFRLQETYTSQSRVPTWMDNEGYLKAAAPDGDGGSWSFFQMQDWAVIYMWQDVMAAFAARYAGDPRIAAFNIDEVYPTMWEQETLCGNVHDLSDDARAANAGLMEVMKAYLDVDPGMLWAPVNWYPTVVPGLDVWENGLDLGDGQHTLGANDLPGVQGHYRQDIKFFQSDEGSGTSCGVDVKDGAYFNRYLAQYDAVNDRAPVFVGSESNGWTVGGQTTHRVGAGNPWGVSAWPDTDPPGSLPNDDGSLFPSARFWVWYTSSTPRATDQDSGLGQSGVDPCGVLPANFYCMEPASYSPSDHPAWTPTNLSIAAWRAAIDTFGPSGTRTMFKHPPGYLDQFDDVPDPTPSAKEYTVVRTAVAPSINGSLDEFATAAIVTVGSGTYRLMWDDEALYVGLEVEDASIETPVTGKDADLWLSDSLELMVDTGNNDGTEADGDDSKLFVAADGSVHDARGGAGWDLSFDANVIATAVSTTSGYVIEARLPLSGLGSGPWGFELAVNDIDAGVRTQTVWANTNGGDANDPAGWGSLTFSNETTAPPPDESTEPSSDSDNDGSDSADSGSTNKVGGCAAVPASAWLLVAVSMLLTRRRYGITLASLAVMAHDREQSTPARRLESKTK